MITHLAMVLTGVTSAPPQPVPVDSTAALLARLWFLILMVLLAGYAMLDGFDLGVGILQPFVPKDEAERRTTILAIGPLWDGNEVWLVTFGGSMFAMFPYAYASIFSALYIPFMLLLWMLIFRATSIEFRDRMRHSGSRRAWDWGFFAGSFGAAVLFGVAVGNGVRGIPLDARGTFTGTILDLLHPYCLMTGALAVVMFALHGAIYLHLKTEGALCRRLRQVMWKGWCLFVILFVVCSLWTVAKVPRATLHLQTHPWLYVAATANILAVANVGRCIRQNRARAAFASSCATILTLVLLGSSTVFPNMVTAADPRFSLTIYQTASSVKTLTIGLIIVAIGIPLVTTYTAIIYWTFRGKVRPTQHG